MTTTATETLKVIGFTYDGTLDCSFFESDEQIAFTGGNGKSNVVVSSPRGHVRFKVGDLVTRRPDGSLFSTSTEGNVV